MVVVRVVLLDKENFETEIKKHAVGQELYNNVKQKLNLEESDYFSLSYRNAHNLRFWLNLDKRIDKQLETMKNLVFYWEVKFYPPAPDQLNEDLTKYLIVLQLRQDIMNSRLPASFQTMALLGSYTVQGELGDRDSTVAPGDSYEYLEHISFTPNQSPELLYRISELHKTHKGQTPAEADIYFLENAKRMALYGTDLYPVVNATKQPVLVGVSASGLFIYDKKIRVKAFRWPRIIKISYKRNVFMVKVRPGQFEKDEKTFGYKLPSSRLAKRLWRISVETHQFFRLTQPELTDTKPFSGTFGRRPWRLSVRTANQLKSVGTIRRPYSRSNSISSSREPSHRGVDSRAPDELYPSDPVIDDTLLLETRGRGPRRDLNLSCSSFDRSVRPPKPSRKISKATLDETFDSDGEEYVTSNRPGQRPASEPRSPASVARSPASIARSSASRPRSPGSEYATTVDDGRDGVFIPEAPNAELSPEQSARLQSGAPIAPQRSPQPRYQPRCSRPSRNSAEPATSPRTAMREYQPRSHPTDQSARVNGIDDEPIEDLQAPSRAPDQESSTLREGEVETIPPMTNTAPEPDAASLEDAPLPSIGFGSLPLPVFSLESAGVMPSGSLDKSARVETSERAERLVRLGQRPPTVATHTVKFNPLSSRPEPPQSTRSPPTIPTEARHFPAPPFDGASAHSDEEETIYTKQSKLSETTTTRVKEQDGYTEKRVKHKIVLEGDEPISDQMLLDAIQAVTGLDSKLGVDRIEIKTEEENEDKHTDV